MLQVTISPHGRPDINSFSELLITFFHDDEPRFRIIAPKWNPNTVLAEPRTAAELALFLNGYAACTHHHSPAYRAAQHNTQ